MRSVACSASMSVWGRGWCTGGGCIHWLHWLDYSCTWHVQVLIWSCLPQVLWPLLLYCLLFALILSQSGFQYLWACTAALGLRHMALHSYSAHHIGLSARYGGMPGACLHMARSRGVMVLWWDGVAPLEGTAQSLCVLVVARGSMQMLGWWLHWGWGFCCALCSVCIASG